jgi:hypothetical protein
MAAAFCYAASGADPWSVPNDPAYRRYPADPHQESLFLLDMEKAWKLEKGSPKVLVAVVDLAFNVEHPDLKAKLWSNPREVPGNGMDDDGNGYVDDIHGWDFLDNDATLDGPQSEHGNHVAGILAAQTNNGIGIAGMAPNCLLMLAKVGLPGALRDGRIMARAVRYCADNGARLICMNHGLSEYYPGWHVPVGGELKEACDYAYRRGSLVISCTTSNDGAYYAMAFPCGYDSVMGTGASDLFGKPSSMYGGSRACEVVAPGGQRDTGNSHSKEAIYSCFRPTGTQYNYWSGGCMATPHVVGLLALVLSHYEGIDVEQARQIVRNTAKGEKPGVAVRWGHGLIQPVAALSLAPGQIAACPKLDRPTPSATKDAQGKRVVSASVGNTGALDARVLLHLLQGGRKVASRELAAPGLETTKVTWAAEGLPPAEALTIRMESLGMARPRDYDGNAEIKLRIASEDVSIRSGDGGRKVLTARVRNEGSVAASRVAVIVHHHEPGVAKRIGPVSRMIEAQVITVPAAGVAEAEFPLESLPPDSDLWIEIEQLDVGAPHVPRDRGKARLGGTRTTQPQVKPVVGAIPGVVEMDKVVRVLLPGEPETLGFEMAAPGACRVRIDLLEGVDGVKIDLLLRAEGAKDERRAALGRSPMQYETQLQRGRHLLELQSPQRIAYRLNIDGPADVWQDVLRATDRGAGAKADHVAWLATPAPGKGRFEVFDCSEGARFLFLAPGGRVQTVLQTGGVMGDSSVKMGGAGVWRQHGFQSSPAHAGAWFCYPSDLNASGDYALRGNFTIHWRRPDDETTLRSFADSPTMLARKLRIRGGQITPQNRRQRYRDAIDAGMQFMTTLTEKRDDGYWMYERWIVDQQGPRIYWGNDGQMLCARTFEHVYRRTRRPEYQAIALGIAGRVVGYQRQLDATDRRCGAIPYGIIGRERKTSWASSNNIQGKILYGLAQLATATGDVTLLAALRRNADYFVGVEYEDGRWPHFVESRPQSVCGYASAWGVAGLLVAYDRLGDKRYLAAAEKGLVAFFHGRTPAEGLQSDGSIICHCNHGNPLEDDHAIRSSITMLTPVALAYRMTKHPQYREVLDGLHRYLAARQHTSGAIKQADVDCVNLIYAQNWGPQGFCDAYEATGNRKFLDTGLRLADFLVRVQLVDADPHLHGAWVGSYNVAKDLPGGIMDDEGNLYDLYTSWGAGPIVYGLERLLPHAANAE